MKAARQSGFTLVELMISILIGLFLVGGLLTLTGAMRRTYSVQNGLTQLGVSERVAFTLLTDVMQQAGYFTNPTVKTAAVALPAIGSTFSAGAGLYGVGDTSATPSETLSVRYMTTGTGTGGDGVLNCLGAASTTATTAAPVTWINTFSLDGNGNLQCTLTTNGVAAAPVTLMTGVINLYFFYFLQANTGSGNNSVDTELQAPAVTSSGNWPNVMAVEIVMYFTNPLHASGTATAGQTTTQAATVGLSRTVVLMSKVGVTS